MLSNLLPCADQFRIFMIIMVAGAHTCSGNFIILSTAAVLVFNVVVASFVVIILSADLRRPNAVFRTSFVRSDIIIITKMIMFIQGARAVLFLPSSSSAASL